MIQRWNTCRAAVLALLVTLGGATWADATPTDLQHALTKVYDSNPRLMAARARARAIDETVPEARAGWRPTLSSTNSAGIEWSRTSEKDRTSTISALGVTLDQPLHTGGAVDAEIDAAKRRVRAEHADLRAIEQEVLVETVEAYTAVYRDQLILEFALENEQRLFEQLTIVQARHEKGVLTDTDLAQAESRYEGAITERIQAKADLLTSGAAYRRLVGEPPGELAVPLPLKQLPLSEVDALSRIDFHPSLIAAREAFEAARFDVDRAKAEMNPRLLLRGQINHADQPNTYVDSETSASLSTILTVPLYQGGGPAARVRRSRQTVAEQRYLVDDAKLAVEAQAIEAWQDLTAARRRARSLETQAKAASLALTGVRAEADIGLRTISDILDAERELFLIQTETARLLRQHVTSSYRLKAAVGELTVRELELETQTYDPNLHYEDVRGKWYGTGEALEDKGLTPEGDRSWEDNYWFLKVLKDLTNQPGFQ